MTDNDPNALDEQAAQALFTEMYKAVQTNDHVGQDRLVSGNEPETQEVKEPVSEELTKTEEVATDLEGGETVSTEAATSGETALPPEGEKDPRDAELERLRQELEKQRLEAHKLRSDAGRVPSLQRKLKDIERRLQEAPVVREPAATKRTNDLRVPSEKLAQIKESDPLVAEAIEEAILAGIQSLRQEQESERQESQRKAREREEEAIFNQEKEKLLKAYGNAYEVFAHPEWKQWKASLPEEDLELATSMYADDVILALEKYGHYLVEKYPNLRQAAAETTQQATTTSTSATTTPDPKAAQAAEARARKLTNQVPTSEGSKAVKDTGPIDEAAYFSKVFAEEAAKFKRK
jgi:hypothetical protein